MRRYYVHWIGVAALAACARAPAADRPEARDAGARAVDSGKPLVLAPAPAPDLGEQLVEASTRVRESVVAVSAGNLAADGAASSPFEGTPFGPFLRALPPQPHSPAPRGMGSAVVIDDAGHILTNQHLIEDADSVRVKLSQSQVATAKVVGRDARTDLAVLELDPAGLKLTPARLGDSDALRVGEVVLACGNPYGLRQVVNAGIVSALGRGSEGTAEYEDFILTDAAIHEGNSGGPLVDRWGRVIGINTAIASRTEGYGGIGFAIPINMARRVMQQLLDRGRVVRGDIGVNVGHVSDELAQSFGYRGSGGALVQDVTTGTPAERAGLQPGDIIVERNAKAVASAAEFRDAIASAAPGKTIKLKVFRSGKLVPLEVEVTELEASTVTAGTAGAGGASRWGLDLSAVTPELRERLNFGNERGAVILQVEPNSPADDAGLRAGDLLASVGDAAVQDADHARRLLLTAKSPLRLRIVHDGRGTFVVLRGRE